MSSDAALPFPQALTESATCPDVKPPKAETGPADSLTLTANERSDEELLEAVGNGEKHALSILFRRHGSSVLNVARRILRNEAEAEDLRQDVFLYLFESARLYDAKKSSTISWIMQITYHRAFNRRKFLNLRQGDNVEVFDEQRVDRSVTQPSTDQMDGKAILDKVREQLSVPQRQTLELHFFEGYTFREIADQSGQTIGNVRHHYYRALDILRSNVFSKKVSESERIGGHLHRKGN